MQKCNKDKPCGFFPINYIAPQCFKESCTKHDNEYTKIKADRLSAEALLSERRLIADRQFLSNMLKENPVRSALAKVYYTTVRIFGRFRI